MRGRLLLAAALAVVGPLAPAAAEGTAPAPKKKIAIVATLWAYLSHGQHMGDRFLTGYPRHGAWHESQLEVAAAYVDQKPDSDLSARRAAEHGFVVYPTIAEALRCGGDKLAVDGVVIIGEHGQYPKNAKGQVEYPRFELFQEVVKVFEQDGKSVPVFNDKHLSYDKLKAARMVADSRRLGFPFRAGSSLPVTWRSPPLEIPYGAGIREAMAVAVGEVDSMGFHALEAMQSMIERRRGGETGVKAVHYLQGDEVWRAGEEGRWSQRLLEAALSCSDSLHGDSELESRPQNLAANGKIPALLEEPAIAVLIEHEDGLRSSLLVLNGVLGDFNFAAEMEDGKVVANQFYLPPEPNVAYSSCLMAQAEDMIVTGRTSQPIERTWLVSALLDCALESKIQGGRRLETPELAIRYRAQRFSRFGETAALPPVFRNSLGMPLVYCPPGRFRMGSPADDPQAAADEQPAVDAELTRGFYLGRYEVTQAEWRAVMLHEPWKGAEGVIDDPRAAAAYVSWDDVQEFCRRLSAQEGRTYALPTGAQWEYACRAGAATRYSYGDDPARLGDYAWWGSEVPAGNARTERFTHPVGQKRPNAWGFYDMHGNVWEWCADAYQKTLVGGRDPYAPGEASSPRQIRGGGWCHPAVDCRSAYRPGDTPDSRHIDLGFRVVLLVDED